MRLLIDHSACYVTFSLGLFALSGVVLAGAGRGTRASQAGQRAKKYKARALTIIARFREARARGRAQGRWLESYRVELNRTNREIDRLTAEVARLTDDLHSADLVAVGERNRADHYRNEARRAEDARCGGREALKVMSSN